MKNKKYIKSMGVSALSVLLIAAMASPVLAETKTASSEKEEVIYVMTDASGKVTDMEAVNIFAGGEITDYGDYSDVKMLNTTDNIEQNGDEITFSSDAEKVYYQGTMKTTAIPWNISIRYYLDGTEYTADELAGKSGELEIRFQISENKSYKGSFYDNYALQASFTLNTERCKNIEADGATLANVGSNKQISYTILPGKGADAVINADVTDFEMDAVAINGVQLSLDVDIDDSELMDKVDELIGAIGDLDEGASELNDGSGTLSEAVQTLDEKVGELYSGAGSLSDGAGELYSGLSGITAKSSQLTGAAYTAYEGLCTAAASALNSQLEENGMAAVSLTPSNYASALLNLLAQMNADAVYNQAYQSALQTVTQQVEAKADELYQGYIQSQANIIYQQYVSALPDITQAAAGMSEEQKSQLISNAVSRLTDEQKAQILQGALASMTDEQKTQIREAYIQQMMASDEVTSGINSAVSAVSTAAAKVSELKGQLDSYGAFYQGLLSYTGAVGDAASGANTLKESMETMYSGVGTLQDGVGELSDGVQELSDGMQELKDGTSEFVEETDGMDTKITDEIDSMTASITGGDAQTESFVSEKNTNVDAVQFVIKTAAIEQEEEEADTAEEEESLKLWQKFLRLFGLY